MKTYKEFITELNKFEKFVAKQGIKALKKFNPKRLIIYSRDEINQW